MLPSPAAAGGDGLSFADCQSFPQSSVSRGTAFAQSTVVVDDGLSGAIQVVFNTSTDLMVTTADACDQDVDCDLYTFPRRHPGGRNGLDAFVPRAIDERNDRGTGYARGAHLR